jgi:hypothetical protein
MLRKTPKEEQMEAAKLATVSEKLELGEFFAL